MKRPPTCASTARRACCLNWMMWTSVDHANLASTPSTLCFLFCRLKSLPSSFTTFSSPLSESTIMTSIYLMMPVSNSSLEFSDLRKLCGVISSVSGQWSTQEGAEHNGTVRRSVPIMILCSLNMNCWNSTIRSYARKGLIKEICS